MNIKNVLLSKMISYYLSKINFVSTVLKVKCLKILSRKFSFNSEKVEDR